MGTEGLVQYVILVWYADLEFSMLGHRRLECKALDRRSVAVCVRSRVYAGRSVGVGVGVWVCGCVRACMEPRPQPHLLHPKHQTSLTPAATCL